MKSIILLGAGVAYLALSSLPVRAGYPIFGPDESKKLTPGLRTFDRIAIAYDLANVQEDFIRQEQNRQSSEQRCQALKYDFVFAPDPGGSSRDVGEYALDSKGRIFTRGRDESGCDNVPEYHATIGETVRYDCPTNYGKGYNLNTWVFERDSLVNYRKYVDWDCGVDRYGSIIERDEYLRLYYCGEELVSRRYISGMVKAGFRRYASTCRGL